MCIVVDTNAFASVFDRECASHDEFKPVLDWILKGKGKIVYGGTRYRQELGRAHRYLRIFGQLARARKTVTIADDAVDKVQSDLEELLIDDDFDDAHLVAIVIVSHCRLICTHDRRSHSFIKNRALYPKKVRRPKIYSSGSHCSLLCDQNIATVCR